MKIFVVVILMLSLFDKILLSFNDRTVNEYSVRMRFIFLIIILSCYATSIVIVFNLKWG